MLLAAAGLLGVSLVLVVEEAKDVSAEWVDGLVATLTQELNQRDWQARHVPADRACEVSSPCASAFLERAEADAVLSVRVFGGLRHQQVILELATLDGVLGRVDKLLPVGSLYRDLVPEMLDAVGLRARPTFQAATQFAPANSPLAPPTSSAVPEFLPWVLAGAGIVAETTAVVLIQTAAASRVSLAEGPFVGAELEGSARTLEVEEHTAWILLGTGAVLLGLAAFSALVGGS